MHKDRIRTTVLYYIQRDGRPARQTERETTMKMHYQQPKRTLPHVNDLATCERMMSDTVTAIRRIEDTDSPVGFVHNYRQLLRELCARKDELAAR
jgi:hypothetical protein